MRDLLLQMAGNNGSLFAGVNADDEDAGPIVERAIELGYVALRRDSWGTGDFYLLTREGWAAIGQPQPEPFGYALFRRFKGWLAQFA